MNKRLILWSILCFTSMVALGHDISSPNRQIKVHLEKLVQNRKTSQKSGYYFSVSYQIGNRYTTVMKPSFLGIVREDDAFDSTLVLTNVSKPLAIHEKYDMVSGKKLRCQNEGVEQRFSFINHKRKKMDILFRVYNDGVAFSYVFPEVSSKTYHITEESTNYLLPDSSNYWMQPYNSAYEDFYNPGKTGRPHQNKQWGFPALFEISSKSIWMLISEANNSSFNCATRLSAKPSSKAYFVTYPESRGDFKQVGVATTLPWKSQWHTLMIGSLATIVKSTLVTDVSEPNQLKDVSWVKPGAASWIYWANNHGTKDYQKVITYIDLAQEMGWPYSLIDWEWDVMSNGGKLEDAVAYARTKGIKPLLWYNSGTSWLEPTPSDRLNTPEKRSKEFAWLQKIGVYGIKVDFFAGDQQDMMKYYLDLLQDAAKYHLAVNFHGATIPRGWARTYPNLLSTEAVYGAEWYNNKPILTNEAAKHNTILPFTRNVIGSMDYTPVTFSDSQHPHITSYAHELALAVVFESGLQHFADRPESYLTLPKEPKDFLKQVPTVWDDTKLLDGYPGESVIVARRKGQQWYVGGLNGSDSKRTLHISPEAFGLKQIKVKLIGDGENTKSFSSKEVILRKGEDLKIDCLPRGGFAATVTAL